MWVYTCCLLLVSTYLYRYVLCLFVPLLFVFGVLSTIQKGRKLHNLAGPDLWLWAGRFTQE